MCSICGYRYTAVIPLLEEQSSDEPVVAMECPECHNFAVHPDGEDDE